MCVIYIDKVISQYVIHFFQDIWLYITMDSTRNSLSVTICYTRRLHFSIPLWNCSVPYSWSLFCLFALNDDAWWQQRNTSLPANDPKEIQFCKCQCKVMLPFSGHALTWGGSLRCATLMTPLTIFKLWWPTFWALSSISWKKCIFGHNFCLLLLNLKKQVPCKKIVPKP